MPSHSDWAFANIARPYLAFDLILHYNHYLMLFQQHPTTFFKVSYMSNLAIQECEHGLHFLIPHWITPSNLQTGELQKLGFAQAMKYDEQTNMKRLGSRTGKCKGPENVGT